MTIKKPILWMSGAVLAAAFFAATMWTGRRGDAAPKPAVESDLVTFVKPAGAPARAEKTTAELPPVMPSVAQYAPSDHAPAASAPLTPAQLVATEQAVREMRAQGAGEEAIYRLRAMTLTADVAAQLARMESEEATWKARVDAYLAERSKLAAGDAAPDTDLSLVVQNLRDAHFTAAEQQRLNAYEPPMKPRLTLQ